MADLFPKPAQSPYRRWLERDLGGIMPACVFIMLNPSTADDRQDDPTIRRCKHFAALLGCKRLIVVNLFTLRATDPEELLDSRDQSGPGCCSAIEEAFCYVRNTRHRGDDGGYVIAAWGASFNKPLKNDRVAWVRAVAQRMGRRLHCLGLTDSGQPRHPLYVKNSAPLVEWP